MRSDKDRLPLITESREHVCGRVAPNNGALRGKPAADEVPRALLVGGQTEARDGRTVAADPRELGHAAPETLTVDHRTFSGRSSGANDTSANTSRSMAFACGIARTISAAYFGFRRAVSWARSSSGSTT